MNEIPVVWWAVRVSGLVAYGALWWAMLFGVWLSGRGAGGVVHSPSVIELHRQWAIVGLGAGVVHGVASVLAPEGGVPPLALLVPMVSPVLRVPVTLGTLTLWGVALLVFSSLWRAKLSIPVWRVVHVAAFVAWVFGVAHALGAGTDLVNPLVEGGLLASVVVFGAAFVHRVMVTLWGPAGRSAAGQAR